MRRIGARKTGDRATDAFKCAAPLPIEKTASKVSIIAINGECKDFFEIDKNFLRAEW